MTFWGWPWRADQSDKKYDALIDAVVNVFGERPQAVLSGSYFTFPAILRVCFQSKSKTHRVLVLK